MPATPADETSPFAGHPANVIFNEVIGTFLCVCGEPSDFEDCMLPAYHECPKCKRFFHVVFFVSETEKAAQP